MSVIACNKPQQNIEIRRELPHEIVFISDSIFLNNQKIIDSLSTVKELLTHLESIPIGSK